MKAGETTIKDLLEGDKLYVVPLYQRRYAWDREDWAQLWRAVTRQYECVISGNGTAHFIGSVVIAHRQGFPTDAPNFDVIDGQQRLTTLLILLASIRDMLSPDDKSHQRADSFLKNSFETGEFVHKLRPGDDDRKQFNLIVDGSPTESHGLIRSAYTYFTERIAALSVASPVDGAALVRAATSRLEVVQILTAPEDNAHRIFQTLNSTGKELTAVDLLRNHFFMLLPRQVTTAYEGLWRPLSQELGDLFPSFLWTDLVTRRGLESVPNRNDRIYAEWQAILEPRAGDEDSVLEELSRLHDRGQAYMRMRTASTGESSIDARLTRLNEWGVAVHHPLTFAVMERWRARTADSTRTIRALEYIESFLVRRMLAGVPTNNLNRIFTTSVGQLHLDEYASQDVDVAVHRILSQPGKYWPSDEALLNDGLTIPFYERQRSTQRQFILRRIEEAFAGKYAPNWGHCNFTIEHVMPQVLTGEWIDFLKDAGEEDPVDMHARLRHSIGNLTLTCENPELGQMSLAAKQKVYANDIMKMNDDVAELESWGELEILNRGRLLLSRASEVWSAPLGSQKLDDYALATEMRTIIQAMPKGRWIDIGTLADYLDADPETLERATPLLDIGTSAQILTGDGNLRDTLSPSERTAVIELLIESGVIETAEGLPALLETKVTTGELETQDGQ